MDVCCIHPSTLTSGLRECEGRAWDGYWLGFRCTSAFAFADTDGIFRCFYLLNGHFIMCGVSLAGLLCRRLCLQLHLHQFQRRTPQGHSLFGQPQPQQPLKNMFLFPSSLMYNDHLIFSFMSLIHVSGYVSDFVAVSVSLLSKRRICIALHYI